MDERFRKPTAHSMKRRKLVHDYSRRGVYHITISVAAGQRQPFGRIAGRLDRPDGAGDGPHVELTAVGRMVEEELTQSIRRYYPMLEVLEYVVMPEHLHFLLVAHGDVVSQNGNATHLGHVIAGFKYGCNKRFWALTGRISLATESPGTVAGASAGAAPKAAGAGGETVLGDSVAKKRASSQGQLPPLFDKGYCDVMPVDDAQLVTQRAYIRANPRSRLLRTSNRQWLQPQRRTVDTAVSLPALRGYLQRECAQAPNEELFALLAKRLLQDNGHVACDSYGNAELLQRRLLPVVCHRADAALFPQQKARCLSEAAAGAVLVSARISRGEQEIVDAALLSGFPVIRIEDNGFPDLYHPSADRMDDCAASLLLLLTPWSYQYTSHDEAITVPFCKTMNCIAQAVCRTKDSWWKK